MLNEIKNHRSIRKYKSDPVPDDVLNEILSAASRASNTGNMQLYSVIVTRSADIKQKLSPAHFNQGMITSAPVVLTFCADVNRFTKWCKQRNADVGFNNLESLVTAFVDTSIAAQNACLEAEAHGLGICYLGTTTYNVRQIIDTLQLPEGVVPVTTVTMGYPDGESSLSSRLPLSAFVHDETYHDYSPADINKAYEALEADPANAKFIEENNKQNIAQVFAEVRYSKGNNEYFSNELLEAFRQQKMM